MLLSITVVNLYIKILLPTLCITTIASKLASLISHLVPAPHSPYGSLNNLEKSQFNLRPFCLTIYNSFALFSANPLVQHNGFSGCLSRIIFDLFHGGFLQFWRKQLYQGRIMKLKSKSKRSCQYMLHPGAKGLIRRSFTI